MRESKVCDAWRYDGKVGRVVEGSELEYSRTKLRSFPGQQRYWHKHF